MVFFFYNTGGEDGMIDQPRPRYGMMIDQRFAVVSGSLQAFGRKLRWLSPDDTLFMYENGVGIVAVGRVLEHWDEVSHRDPVYYTPRELANFKDKYEYRIAVEWFMDLRGSPIGIDELRERFGYTPRGIVQKIVGQRSEAEVLVEELERTYGR